MHMKIFIFKIGNLLTVWQNYSNHNWGANYVFPLMFVRKTFTVSKSVRLHPQTIKGFHDVVEK